MACRTHLCMSASHQQDLQEEIKADYNLDVNDLDEEHIGKFTRVPTTVKYTNEDGEEAVKININSGAVVGEGEKPESADLHLAIYKKRDDVSIVSPIFSI